MPLGFETINSEELFVTDADVTKVVIEDESTLQFAVPNCVPWIVFVSDIGKVVPPVFAILLTSNKWSLWTVSKPLPLT